MPSCSLHCSISCWCGLKLAMENLRPKIFQQFQVYMQCKELN